MTSRVLSGQGRRRGEGGRRGTQVSRLVLLALGGVALGWLVLSGGSSSALAQEQVQETAAGEAVAADEAPSADEAEVPAPLPAAIADARRVREALEQTGARTELDDAGWRGYMAHLLDSFQDWVLRSLARFFDNVPLSAEVLRYVLRGLVVVAVLVLLWGLVRVVMRRLRAPASRHAGDDHDAVDDVEVPRRAAAEWRRLAEEHLAAGRGRAALGALWWWLAESLLPGRVDASWTTRQLLREIRRPPLRPPLGRLDGLLYGAPEPTPEAVRALDRELRELELQEGRP